MCNKDLMATCKYHFLTGTTRCMVDKCGLNGKGCILAEEKIVYATPETQAYFGAYRSKSVPVHNDCPNYEKDTLPPYESSCAKYASDGIAAKWAGVA